MRAALVAIACLAACHARLSGSGAPDGSVHGDGATPDQGIPIDAPRVCAGGDGHMTDAMGNCFVFFQTPPKTYVQAKAACAALPAHLAKITDAAQNVIIAGLAHGFDTFIGADDMITEGTFLWNDSTAVTYNNYRTGVPNNGGGVEDCLIIEGKKTPDDTWDDRPCDNSVVITSGVFSYLCEY